MPFRSDFNIFVGGTIGSFKGIKVEKINDEWKGIVKNIQNVEVLDKAHEITAMSWSDAEERDILLGLADQSVKIYDTEFKAFTSSVNLHFGTGTICGLSRYDNALLTAVESGHVKVWKFRDTDGCVIETGAAIKRMRHGITDKSVIATGGEENDLQLWNLETKQCVFQAKNVRPDHLQLRVPVWVSDIVFLPSSQQVAVCTRYGQVRLYDPSTRQRRPVINVEIPERTLTSMCAAPKDKHVVVGTGTGHMMMVDLRGKGFVVKTYKGSVGSIRSVACNGLEPYIISVGLDRYIKVHHLETNELIYKEYLKSRLNCALLRSNLFTLKVANDSDIELIHLDDDDIDVKPVLPLDQLFDDMESIEEPKPKKRKKKKKKKEEQSRPNA